MPTRIRRPFVTLLALGLLSLVGFTAGALAGLVWEQPRLVLAYLTGRTTEIAWSGSEELPSVAAGPTAEASAVTPAAPGAPNAPKPTPSLQALAEPVPEQPRVVAAAKPAPRFSIQVGAFGRSEAAEKLASQLERRGYDAFVTPGAGQGKARWRVRVGPVKGRERAQELAARLKRDEKLPTWILDEDGG